MKLSVIIPAYNEERTIGQQLERLLRVPFERDIDLEILVIDDFSSDETASVASQVLAQSNVSHKVITSENNRGKGYAIRKGFEAMSGELVVILDADLEYDPTDIDHMLDPIFDGVADVVYGSRFIGYPRRVLYFWHYVGNKLLTLMSNVKTDINLSDMETCLKLFRVEILKKITLTEDRFGIEPEITAKVAKIPGVRFYEVGVSYHGRTYAEGKKINWKDGIHALLCIIKY